MIKEKALLIGVCLDRREYDEKENSMKELELLADTAEIKSERIMIQNRKNINPRYYVGSGFLENAVAYMKRLELDYLIFDNELSPSQSRNIEDDFDITVIDRTEIILKIFNDHAKTNEARLQVKLAELNYQLPRLKKLWSHLDREKGQASGAAGTSRGMGEKQIEVDKRLVRHEILKVTKQLQKVDTQKETRRKSRSDMKKICLVGYTNAGKSTLFNQITDAGVLEQNKLFATLGTTSRTFNTGKGHDILLSDTVGFISKLPHHLVASFRATLKDVLDADYLLHVVDISDDRFEFYIREVQATLKLIGADHIRQLYVFNKIDRVEDMYYQDELVKKEYPNHIKVSAKTGYHVDKMLDYIDHEINKSSQKTFFFPHTDQKKINFIHKYGKILDKKYKNDGVWIKSEINKEDLSQISKFVID